MHAIESLLDIGGTIFIVYAIICILTAILKAALGGYSGSSSGGCSSRDYDTDNSSCGGYGSSSWESSYDDDMRDEYERSFMFVDFDGNWRKYGEDFIDGQGHYASWSSFQDQEGRCGDHFIDGRGNYASLDGGFYDWAGNWVPGRR